MKEKIIKMNVFIGSILILTGIFIQFENTITTLFKNNKMNLSLAEVDTYYDNSNSIEQISYVDTSWNWPTTNEYYLSSYYSNYPPAIDIVPNNGDLNIYSAYSGEVVTNSYKWDGGNYIVIKQDNGYCSLYCHLSQKLVNVGDKVTKGQVIGIMGRTGVATGVHLHYSIWTGYPYYSSSVNPLDFY